jgi:UDPglucose 6-dehydrogenase
MNITIIGAGYVGLVGAVCFAQKDHNVLAIEVDEKKLALLKEGNSPIYEENIEAFLKEGLKKEKLGFSGSIEKGVRHADIIMICVGTPENEDGTSNLTWVEEACRAIAREAGTSYKLIVEKSTVPVNTHKKILDWAAEENPGHQISVASNPEFLREGKAIEDFMQAERIVIGCRNTHDSELLTELYKPFTDTGSVLVNTDVVSSELIKQASNSFLAMKISYINMVSQLCERVGADIDAVAYGMGLDSRIGNKFLKAGVGFGGSCFPKDLNAFYYTAKEENIDFELLRATININHTQKQNFFNRILAHIPPEAKKIALWGLAFKADTDDVRETPAIDFVNFFTEKGFVIKAYDPQAAANFHSLPIVRHDRTSYVYNLEDTLKESDFLVVLTDWKEFKEADFAKVKESLTTPYIFDGRNFLDTVRLQQIGLKVIQVGK